ncbi:MAG: hypothetical protein BGO00_12695 [Alphaproteobacteria bacterium 62-8]|nr:MAG: hypothetical protein BGO00_12695 [Alphaproteobacteria bacterium 62-8]
MQARQIGRARNLDRAELFQMGGQKLRIQQSKAAADQPRHQMHQRHFARVARAGEHTLAKERGTQRDTVKSTDQLAVLAAFDGVGEASFVQRRIKPDDLVIDPALLACCTRRGTGSDNGGKILIGRDRVIVAANGARQSARQVKSVQRNDAPPVR